MIVEPSHRAETTTYPRQTYQELADRIVGHVSKVPTVSSIVVCGSLIKDTLVPGWSDLDFVIFLEGAGNNIQPLIALREAITQAKGETQIGIGIDVVYREIFERHYRLGGRPLAMTFEVAGYGKSVFGVNPFVELKITDQLRQLIEYDRKQAIRAELHNWCRSFLLLKDSDDVHWLSRCTKTVLKLLKHETDPNLTGPYTYDAALEAARKRSFPARQVELFSAAVEYRLHWLSICADECRKRDGISFLESGISNYQ